MTSTTTIIKTTDEPGTVTVAAATAITASSADSGPCDGTVESSHRKSHRRQESMYTMTGLYSETGDDENSSTDGATLDDLELECRSSANNDDPFLTTPHPAPITSPPGYSDSVSKCHSRQPSSSIVDREKSLPRRFETAHDDDDLTQDCGLLTCRPESMHNFARIKIFVMLLSMLVTLQQALSSGYINSVITTIEKRFEIPSSYSGLIASSYEIGNVITVIFVSYLGSRRHIPVWIGIGAVIMGIGSLIFMLPHFTGEINPGISLANKSSDNICRGVSLSEPDMGLGRLSSGLSNSPLVPHNNLSLAVCSVVLAGPIHQQNEPEPNTPENIALIESGNHLQKIEELSGQFEGDIVLTDLQKQAVKGHQRNGLINTTYRWANNIVPYNFTEDLNEVQREEVLKGLRAIEAAAPCISFVQRTTEEHFVEVHGAPTGCWSMVGRIGGKQNLNLQLNGCIHPRVIVHEFLHALGFYHMQSSYERENFVRVAWEHIQDGLAHNFNQYDSDYITHFGHEYDIRSIMHYSAYSFTKNGFATLIPNDITEINRIGYYDVMSAVDIRTLNAMYCDGN